MADEPAAGTQPGTGDTVEFTDVGIYANFCGVVVTAEEAALTFAQRGLGNAKKPQAVSTIYMSHPHLKRLAQAMLNAVDEIESKYGEIDTRRGDDRVTQPQGQLEQSDGNDELTDLEL